jgi:hypothetical protein
MWSKGYDAYGCVWLWIRLKRWQAHEPAPDEVRGGVPDDSREGAPYLVRHGRLDGERIEGHQGDDSHRSEAVIERECGLLTLAVCVVAVVVEEEREDEMMMILKKM